MNFSQQLIAGFSAPEIYGTTLIELLFSNDSHTYDELHAIAHAQSSANAIAHAAHRNISTLDTMFLYYRERIHGPLGVTLCTLSLALNALTCLILRKKEIMVTGNMILVAISASYIAISLAFLPLLITLYCISPITAPKHERNTYSNMIIAIISNQLQLTAHAIVLWLGVLMALQRLICTTSRVPIKQNRFLSDSATRWGIAFIVIMVTTTSIPSFFVSQLSIRASHSNATIYQHTLCVDDYDGISNSSNASRLCRSFRHATDLQSLCTYYVMILRPSLRAPVHWIYVSIHKILPCVLMIILSGFLVRSLQQIVGRRKRLTGAKKVPVNIDCEQGADSRLIPVGATKSVSTPDSCAAHRMRAANREVTRMLVVLVVLMVGTQLPPAILLVWNASVYRRFGDAFDLFSSLDNAASFILYCKMSATFRRQFLEQICSSSSYNFISQERNTTAKLSQRSEPISSL